MLKTLFPSVIFDEVLNFKHNDVIEKVIKDIQRKNIGKDDKKSYTLDGFDWKSEKAVFDLTEKDGVTKLQAKILKDFKDNFLLPKLNDYKNEFTFIHGTPRAKLAYKSWFVVYKKKSQQELHTHGDSMFTSVYFVKTPDTKNIHEGKLVIYNNVNEYSGIRRILIKPKPGRLVIFPSNYPHNVFPHYSNKDRIVVITDVKEKKAE